MSTDDVSQVELMDAYVDNTKLYVEMRNVKLRSDQPPTEVKTFKVLSVTRDNAGIGYVNVKWFDDLLPIQVDDDIFATVEALYFEPNLSFDGVNDWIDLTNDATLWSLSMQQFSFAFWLYPTIWDANDREVFDHGGASNAGIRLFVDATTSGTYRFSVKNSLGTNIFASNTNGVVNKWQHVTCTYNALLGSANMKVYLNAKQGALTGNITDTINLSATAKIAESGNDFKGNIKDFKWWTKYELSGEEVELVYRNDPNAPKPSYWLPMQEGSGNPIDRVIGLTGTLNGPTWA